MKTNFEYIVIDHWNNRAYMVVDIGGVSGLVEKSANTVHNWFRRGKNYHVRERWEIFRGPEIKKSNRGKVNNLKNKNEW